MRPSIAFWLIGIFNLTLRSVFSLFTAFGNDEYWIYRKSLRILEGDLPTTGGPIFYTATELPGSLFPLLVGVPLWFSNGHPIGSALFCALLNFISALITYRLMSELFPKLNKLALYCFVLFAPWGILFTNIWNPSFLHPFSALFFYCIWKLLNNPKSFWASFGIPLSVLCTLQIHLSFVLLVGTLLFCLLLRLIQIPNLKGFTLGGLVGTIPLIPYLIEKLSTNKPILGFLFSNSSFNISSIFQQFLSLPGYFLRFLSFSTGETTRFIASGRGFEGVIQLLSSHSWLWPFFIFGFLMSLGLILISLKFSVRKWSLSLNHYKSAAQKFELIVFLVPLMTAASFLFSVKNPSAHTFWILYPISFYGLLWSWQSFSAKLGTRIKLKLLIVYLISVSIYSIAGYRITQKGILKNVPNEYRQSSFSPEADFFDTDTLV